MAGAKSRAGRARRGPHPAPGPCSGPSARIPARGAGGAAGKATRSGLAGVWLGPGVELACHLWDFKPTKEDVVEDRPGAVAPSPGSRAPLRAPARRPAPRRLLPWDARPRLFPSRHSPRAGRSSRLARPRRSRGAPGKGRWPSHRSPGGTPSVSGPSPNPAPASRRRRGAARRAWGEAPGAPLVAAAAAVAPGEMDPVAATLLGPRSGGGGGNIRAWTRPGRGLRPRRAGVGDACCTRLGLLPREALGSRRRARPPPRTGFADRVRTRHAACPQSHALDPSLGRRAGLDRTKTADSERPGHPGRSGTRHRMADRGVSR